MLFEKRAGALVGMQQGEQLLIEPWGRDALRVRAAMAPRIPSDDWALSEQPQPCTADITFEKQYIRGDGTKDPSTIACIRNGRIACTVNHAGVLSFYRDDELILREYYRAYEGTISEESCCLRRLNREWKGICGADSHALRVRFEAQDGEKIFGMGQYQQRNMDLKGCLLELAQRNSQITVPFAVSSLGYGFLWNNPAIGSVIFGNNYTEWTVLSTNAMDYWITAASDPRGIVENYTAVTGRAGTFPSDLLGLWQCKLRYRTQEEVLEVARRCREEGLAIDMIVIDFFHWTVQGDWKFDRRYWPDPKAMIDELHDLGIKVMVSIWPSVDKRSENYKPMLEQGLLMRTERGSMQTYDYQGDCVEVDVFNPRARAYIWKVCKERYADLGIDAFWLDNSEPDLVAYDFENFRYSAGPALRVGNLYPQFLSRAFYDGMSEDGWTQPVNLLRSCWAGSQKYGNIVWSGDIPSTFASFADQIQCGINMGLAGIPWWTSDIGGFMTENAADPEFQQLLIRWFQCAVYSPILRMHGDRGPHDIPPLDPRDFGGGYLHTGHPNELWSYGEKNYEIMRTYLNLRMDLREYIQVLFDEAHENGSPLLRAMFYEFPKDPHCWELHDQYMFGDRFLVAPILHLDEFERTVYLPEGSWRLTSTRKEYLGPKTVTVDAPLEYMPVFERLDKGNGSLLEPACVSPKRETRTSGGNNAVES